MQDRRIRNSVIVLRRHYQNLNGFRPREQQLQQVFSSKSHFKSQYIARPFVGRQSSFHEQAPNCNSCTIDTRNCETSLLLLPHASFRTIKTLQCAPALLGKNRVTPIELPCRCAVFRWGTSFSAPPTIHSIYHLIHPAVQAVSTKCFFIRAPGRQDTTAEDATIKYISRQL